uniref:Putative reverse transcriptase domain-containing protein n=1 Tax=Tanacetum cinerariifolium TaxID=118510 RepID=A0A6L2M6W6_TANCI|nr:putative reverse transcriptase domain-containing protein [Tanacetum cinerariifolium]
MPFGVNQCTSGFHGLDEPGGSRGSFEVGVGAAKKGEVVCLVSMYEFWLQEVCFLRHVVNSYYRRFIVKSLASMTQKNQKYEWGREQEKAFQTLKDNLLADTCSRKERVKLRRVKAMSMTIWSSVTDKILATQGEASKVENATVETLRGLEQLMESKEDEDYSMEKLARLYIDEIIAQHGVPVSIILDRDLRFTSRFWKTLPKALGTRLDMSTAYHPQTDGQSKRTIQTLDDMLRACVIDFGGSWEVHLPLAKFSCNNSYHLSIRCAPFEALYGRKYRVVLIKERLKVTRDRQKSYTDSRRKHLEFEVGDQVLLKVSPWIGVVCFEKKGKLAPRYVGPFEILERIGPVAYHLRLPEELSSVHDTFHVSNLKKCLTDANLHVPLDEIKVDKTLRFDEQPIEIMDREVKSLKLNFKTKLPKGRDTMTAVT